MNDKRFLQLSLRLLYIGGHNPLIYDHYSKIITYICLLCTVVVWPLVLLKMFKQFDDIDVLVPTFESMMSLYQLTIKSLTIIINRKRFVELLRKIDFEFWDVQDYKREVQEMMEIKKIVNAFWWFGLTYSVGAFVLCSGFAVKPAFNTARQLPLMCWTPDGNPIVFYGVIYAMQAYILFVICPNVGGFDVFYTAISVRISVQFKLLRYELENLVGTESETALKFKKCIKYHRFLLDCCNELMDICSLLLLNQYIAFIIMICVELYGLTETNDPAKVINCIIYLIQIAIEGVLICGPPTLLEDESSKVATAAYLSKWNEITTKSTRKSLRLLMMRSQSSVIFSAGGLFTMNVKCLINIYNTGISFYTLMKNKKYA